MKNSSLPFINPLLGFCIFFFGEKTMEVQENAKLLNELGTKENFFEYKNIIEQGKTNEAVVLALIKTLDNFNPKIRYEVVGILGYIGPKAQKAVPALGKILFSNDEEKELRSQSAFSLGMIGPSALPILAPGVKDKDKFIRSKVLGALGYIAKEHETIPLLIIFLGDEEEDIRYCARSSLIDRTGHLAVPLLKKALTDENPFIKAGAAIALLHADPNSTDSNLAVAEILKHPQASVRKIVVSFDQIKLNKIIVPTLTKTLTEDVDYFVRVGATEGLGKVGPEAKPAVPALIKALAEKPPNLPSPESEFLRGYSALALGQIGPLAKEAVPALIKVMTTDRSHDVRRFACRALGEIGPFAKEAVPYLEKVLENSSLKDEAALSLRKIQKR